MKFNFKRFIRTFRWYLGENLHTLLRWTIGATLGVVILQTVFVMFDRQFSDRASYLGTIEAAGGLCFFFLSVATWVAFSNIFSMARSRKQCAALLSLPASNLEKWLSAFIYVSIVWPLAMMLSYVVGDIVRAFLFWFFGTFSTVCGYPFALTFPQLMDSLLPSAMTWGHPFWLLNLLASLSFTMFIHSCYVFGGSLLRRMPFVIVSGILFVLMVMGFYSWVEWASRPSLLAANNGEITYINPLFYVGMTALFTLALTGYYLSYRLFCRLQVVGQRWVNL